MAIDLFKELLPSVLQTKKNILTDENEKEYNAYVVNMALSQHPDCILFVNEMNLHPNLDNKLQYQFYLNILNAKKRPFQKWYKSTESEDLKNVKEFFGFSNEKAKDALRILTSDQLQNIKQIVDKSGVIK
jgi:hypothetical protein